MSTLGLAVITKNEAKHIKDVIESVPFAIDKVVVDSHSTDSTADLAQKAGARVIVREWPGYAKQKQFAIDQLKTDWILLLDGDEWLTTEAQEEIKKIISGPIDQHLPGYEIPRFEIFMDRPIRYGRGQSFPLRLFKNGTGKLTDKEIHETINVGGEIGRLNHGMLHDSSPYINDRINKIFRDVDYELKYYFKPGIANFRKIFLVPILFFFVYLIKKKSWKDGIPGIIYLVLFSFQHFLMMAKFYEQDQKNKKTGKLT